MVIERKHLATDLHLLIFKFQGICRLMIRAMNFTAQTIANADQGIRPNGALHALRSEIIITTVYIIGKKLARIAILALIANAINPPLIVRHMYSFCIKNLDGLVIEIEDDFIELFIQRAGTGGSFLLHILSKLGIASEDMLAMRKRGDLGDHFKAERMTVIHKLSYLLLRKHLAVCIEGMR